MVINYHHNLKFVKGKIEGYYSQKVSIYNINNIVNNI
jgi:hypothetical protein